MDTKVNTRKFPFAAVLSVIHGRIFGKIADVISLLEFMTGELNIKVSELSAPISRCKPILVTLFPELNNDRVRNDIANIDGMLDFNNRHETSDNLNNALLNGLITSTSYGNMLIVAPISKAI